MTPARLNQVRAIFESAVACEPARREAFVREVCSTDELLRDEVLRLLQAREQAGSFLEEPAVAALSPPASPRPVFAPGDSVAHRFTVQELLGAGGMGEVYRARDRKLRRTVALKVLRSEHLVDPERRRFLLREARAASALNHPHIATVHDLSSGGGIDFITMEYVDGQSLDRLIPSDGLPLREALAYAIEIADALMAAHAHGIVHRDLKPGNVMITKARSVKVLDFGLAKLPPEDRPAGDSNSPGLLTGGCGSILSTQSAGNRVLGTAAYMSPEQAQGRHVDRRSDIFSFGCVLYEMLTGRCLFRRETPAATLLAIVRENAPPLGGRAAALERLVARCLEKDPAARPQQMDEVRSLLEQVKADADRGRLRLRRWLGGAVVAAAVVALAAAWFLTSKRSTGTAPEVVPLTSFPGEEYDPAFSPDGLQLAYVWDGPARDNHDVYVKPLAEGSPVRLTSDPAKDFGPVWSPDGQQIAFYRQTRDGRQVRVVPTGGGPERLIGESRGRTEVSSLAWMADGGSLLIIDEKGPGQPVGIASVSVSSGKKRLLTSPVPGQFPGDARFALSPDGRTLAFLRIRGSIFGREIHLLELDRDGTPRGQPKLLAAVERPISGLDWTPDGRSLIFASDRAGNQRLWRIAARTLSRPPTPEPLAAVGENATTLSVALNGGALAYTRFVYDINVYRASCGEANAALLLASTREDRMASYSPNGGRIAFISDRSGHREIWSADSAGLSPVQLTSFGGPNLTNPRWSPDGSKVAFSAMLNENWDIYTVAAGGGRPVPLTRDPSDESFPSWSRDGKWIYFTSSRAGERQIWKMPAAGGSPTQLTRLGGGQSTESRDGRFLYHTKPRGSGIWTIPVDGGEEKQVLDRGDPYYWALGEAGIYLLQQDAKPPSILFFAFGAASSQEVLTLARDSIVRDLDVSPDERAFLFSRAEQLQSDIMLVRDFR